MYGGQSYAIKIQRKARNPPSRGHWMSATCREPLALSGPDWWQQSLVAVIVLLRYLSRTHATIAATLSVLFLLSLCFYHSCVRHSHHSQPQHVDTWPPLQQQLQLSSPAKSIPTPDWCFILFALEDPVSFHCYLITKCSTTWYHHQQSFWNNWWNTVRSDKDYPSI